MSTLAELNNIYEKYEETLNNVCKTTSPLAKFFGIGVTPRNHPCNMEFYENVGAWTISFLTSAPSVHDLYAATRQILTAAAEQQNEDAYWYMYAAQTHATDLIPLLTAENRTSLRNWYDEHYPQKKRMPAQIEVYKHLCK